MVVSLCLLSHLLNHPWTPGHLDTWTLALLARDEEWLAREVTRKVVTFTG